MGQDNRALLCFVTYRHEISSTIIDNFLLLGLKYKIMMNPLPIEIALIISRFVFDFRSIHIAFGFRLSRQEIYRLFWRNAYVPVPGIITVIISWEIDEQKYRDIDEAGMIWYDSECKHHRGSDRPACIYNDGHRVWCYKGQYHRENGPTLIMYPHGVRYMWFKNNDFHRDQGPAVISDTDCAWYQNGRFIRRGPDYN